MKISLLVLALATLTTASSAFGQQGAAAIIKARAKESAGRPLNLPATGAQPAAGAPAPQPGVAQPNVSKILADLAVIKSRPQATQEQKDKLATDLAGVAPLACTGPHTPRRRWPRCCPDPRPPVPLGRGPPGGRPGPRRRRRVRRSRHGRLG